VLPYRGFRGSCEAEGSHSLGCALVPGRGRLAQGLVLSKAVWARETASVWAINCRNGVGRIKVTSWVFS